MGDSFNTDMSNWSSVEDLLSDPVDSSETNMTDWRPTSLIGDPSETNMSDQRPKYLIRCGYG